MYLSYLLLDQNKADVRRALGNAYEMHRTILRAFDDDTQAPAREKFGILYRLFDERGLKLYVLHQAKADWNKIKNQGFTLAKIANNPKPMATTVESLKAHATYTFDLLCAPTRKVKREGKLGHRQFLATPEERVHWLQRKGEQSGFALSGASLMEGGQLKVFVKKRECEQSALTAVRFQGELTVTDAERFRTAFSKGIGSGKAFGLGMMLLFPRR